MENNNEAISNGSSIEERLSKLEEQYKYLLLAINKEGDKDTKTADQILSDIDNSMDNGERWKLLEELYYRYYNKDNHPRMEIDY